MNYCNTNLLINGILSAYKIYIRSFIKNVKNDVKNYTFFDFVK